MQKIIIIAAPSGSGKTTIVRNLLELYPVFGFSVSCTTRSPRGQEVDGIDYYYLAEKDFLRRIESDDFLEWENVYEGLYYGTLKSEITRIHDQGQWPLLDIDVVGAVNLKEKYGADVLSIFIKPPSIEELRNRLLKRGTDAIDVIEKRVDKAARELSYISEFDYVVVNDDLNVAMQELIDILKKQGILDN